MVMDRKMKMYCDDYEIPYNDEKFFLINKKTSNYEVMELTTKFFYCDQENSVSHGYRDLHFIISFN